MEQVFLPLGARQNFGDAPLKVSPFVFLPCVLADAPCDALAASRHQAEHVQHLHLDYSAQRINHFQVGLFIQRGADGTHRSLSAKTEFLLGRNGITGGLWI